ncbi:hypothetical protein CDAR_169281 [Caerostris darwini]|uniref:Ycf15 n=1 Tax=Caerostris darwini TaxID=1538125 RepID=A0AAV4QHE9_9ARAC|nr:hypothetical protein CDAR_169281 [Caerostris darwini]
MRDTFHRNSTACEGGDRYKPWLKIRLTAGASSKRNRKEKKEQPHEKTRTSEYSIIEWDRDIPSLRLPVSKNVRTSFCEGRGIVFLAKEHLGFFLKWNA